MAITLEAIRAAGGIVHSDGNIFFRDISMLQGLAGAAPALEAPAAPEIAEALDRMDQLLNPANGLLTVGDTSATLCASRDDMRTIRAALEAAPQAPAAPSAVATQVVESLLQLARIVNTAVEDWGESFEDGSSEVTFHKEEADKLEEILEFFDSLPDAPPEEGVILSGPSRAARVLRAMAAPAAPVLVGDGQADAYLAEPGRLATLARSHPAGLVRALARALLAAPAAPSQGAEGWAIDKSTGTDILVYKGCSVIEDEQAHRLLALLSAAPAAPAVDAETAKKAARYDWLRGSNVANGTVLAEHFGGSRMQDFDAVIDAKIAAQAAAKGEHAS